jgi:hypothetical protein
MTQSQQALREQRHRDGIVSQLDQFLDTPHPLAKREFMAKALGISTRGLEALISGSSSPDPRQALHSRVALNLYMAGAGKRAR